MQLFAIFVFVADWRADGYRWRQVGTSRIPRNNPKIVKIHFQVKNSDGCYKNFRKYVYHLVQDATYVVVQYVGDHTFAQDFPHC
jgi:hypothetical protein